MADFIKNAKSGFLEPENWDKVVGELNRKFEEKGLDTRLTKRDLIHRLTEDIQKLKTKIQIKNKRYESAILPQPFLNQNSGPKSGEP